MSINAIVPPMSDETARNFRAASARGPSNRLSHARSNRSLVAASPVRFPSLGAMEEGTYRQAELFYLQKQIQSQTQMVVVLEDGEIVEGCIEWYDRNSIKVRGRSKSLVYKSAIKYMYKLGEQGQ